MGGILGGVAGIAITASIIDGAESNSMEELDNLDTKIGITLGVGLLSFLIGFLLSSKERITINND